MMEYFELRKAYEESARRIIDLEKQSVILMSESLENLGDAYSVCGFSGYGREQVDYYLCKGFDDPLDDIAKRIETFVSRAFGYEDRFAIEDLNESWCVTPWRHVGLSGGCCGSYTYERRPFDISLAVLVQMIDCLRFCEIHGAANVLA